ncbi:hypothetical protein F3Y22_tig00111693pilonHSYRG00027 [Hibiscus syriacus]|uniref:Uncharacterized protein n=1 Tax=Hibiscus syriacus TaxID=106335 RepID=A0A6A2XHY2_HIBSY|nr:hypothetical protein F3Y22_tig00111693pilonHSYRG00027 [Hibiscus syriacus]
MADVMQLRFVEASSVRLRKDIHNAHGYHFLVKFVLVVSSMPQNQGVQSIYMKPQVDNDRGHAFDEAPKIDIVGKEDPSSEHLSPTLTRLLDILVNLAQTGPAENKTSKHSRTKASGHSISQTSSSDRLGYKKWEQDNNKDLEAVQMLQDIFLKAESRDLHAEVLNRMFKIFSSDLENYNLCQELTVPLLILNMAGFPPSLQEIILKILEYAVNVVNCVPEQELLSLCCLLQQPIASELKLTILSFFVKLLSFDQQYKKFLREVGVLEVLLDDLKQHKFLLGSEEHGSSASHLERKFSSSSFQEHLDSKDVIITSNTSGTGGLDWDKPPEYRFVLKKVLKFHKQPLTAFHLSNDLKQLLSGDSGGHLLSWMLSD